MFDGEPAGVRPPAVVKSNKSLASQRHPSLSPSPVWEGQLSAAPSSEALVSVALRLASAFDSLLFSIGVQAESALVIVGCDYSQFYCY